MSYMDMVIVKGDFNAMHVNNPTWIDFSIHDNIINSIIEVSFWSILAIVSLSG